MFWKAEEPPSGSEVVGFRLQAGNFSLSRQRKVTKRKATRRRRRTTTKEEAWLSGALRFSLVAGSADRPSLACLRTLRHPASPRAKRRGQMSAPSLRCSAPPMGDQLPRSEALRASDS